MGSGLLGALTCLIVVVGVGKGIEFAEADRVVAGVEGGVVTGVVGVVTGDAGGGVATGVVGVGVEL